MKTEFISLLFSILAILGSLFTYFVHTRKLNSQQKQINNYQIKKSKEEEDEKKKASIVASICKTDKYCKLKIYNKGEAQAVNIQVISSDIENDNNIQLIVPKNFFPYPSLSPQGEFELTVVLCYGHRNFHNIEFIWDDDFGKQRSAKQTISF